MTRASSCFRRTSASFTAEDAEHAEQIRAFEAHRATSASFNAESAENAEEQLFFVLAGSRRTPAISRATRGRRIVDPQSPDAGNLARQPAAAGQI